MSQSTQKPKPPRRRYQAEAIITLRLPGPMQARLDALAAINMTNRSSLIRQLLLKAMKDTEGMAS